MWTLLYLLPSIGGFGPLDWLCQLIAEYAYTHPGR